MEIIDTIKSTARFGLTYAQNKYNAIIRAANDAGELGHIFLSTKNRGNREWEEPAVRCRKEEQFNGQFYCHQ